MVARDTPVDQDDVDTEPVITRDGTRVEFQSILLHPGESGEIVIELQTPMVDPAFFTSTEPRDSRVVVEDVRCGGVSMVGECGAVESYRFGHKFEATLGSAVSILVRNEADRDVRVGASLVCQEPRPGARELSRDGG